MAAEKSLKLTTKIPTGDVNGLADPHVIRTVMAAPTKAYIALVTFSVPKSDVDNVNGSVVGKVELSWIEPVIDDVTGDAEALQRILIRMYERRTGATVMDANLEDAVRDALGRTELSEEDPED